MKYRSLRIAGYPLKANDLTLEQWEDLSMLEETMRAFERNKPRPVIIVVPRSE